MAFPKLVKPFTASFVDVGLASERLRIFWTYPLGVPDEYFFDVGSEVFLETATNINDVPDEQLICSLSMAAILAGEIMPGTAEFLAAITGQDAKNFQTIVGECKLKAESGSFRNPQIVTDLSVGPEGTVYDVVFQRTALLSSTKTVRIDAWSLSQYSNRVDSAAHAVYCIPGAIHKELNLKKSQLGAAGSANRTAVIDFVANQRFWV